MRFHQSALVAALAVAFTGTLAAQETEPDKDHAERHEAHAEHHADHAEHMEQARERMTVTLHGVNDSGIEGKARMSHAEEAEEPGTHQVAIKLTGTTEGDIHPAHIHQGSCAEGGPVVVALSPVQAGPEVATSTTQLVVSEVLAQARATQAERLAEAEERTEEPEYVEARGDLEEAAADEAHPPLFIQVHAPDGAPVACGDIEHAKKDRAKKDGEKGERDDY